MITLKKTIEVKTDDEMSAQALVEKFKDEGPVKGYEVTGYTIKKKTKKSKDGDLEGYHCKIVLTYAGFWDDLI